MCRTQRKPGPNARAVNGPLTERVCTCLSSKSTGSESAHRQTQLLPIAIMIFHRSRWQRVPLHPTPDEPRRLRHDPTSNEWSPPAPLQRHGWSLVNKGGCVEVLTRQMARDAVDPSHQRRRLRLYPRRDYGVLPHPPQRRLPVTESCGSPPSPPPHAHETPPQPWQRPSGPALWFPPRQMRGARLARSPALPLPSAPSSELRTALPAGDRAAPPPATVSPHPPTDQRGARRLSPVFPVCGGDLDIAGNSWPRIPFRSTPASDQPPLSRPPPSLRPPLSSFLPSPPYPSRLLHRPLLPPRERVGAPKSAVFFSLHRAGPGGAAVACRVIQWGPTNEIEGKATSVTAAVATVVSAAAGTAAAAAVAVAAVAAGAATPWLLL